MTAKKFMVMAAGNFLSDGEASLVDMVEALLADESPGDGIPDCVVLWEPFEHMGRGGLLEQIELLADQFAKVEKEAALTMLSEFSRVNMHDAADKVRALFKLEE